ncbi:unnamed protein product [Clonostachys solani]|uniref:Peptidase A1 domain-containing protein n=1 Tax=Clonostachys solani TaxID=160281 RepID=A0A9P0E8R0_9HYPO|nr:unnamed protein product [Clonostachys solani]
MAVRRIVLATKSPELNNTYIYDRDMFCNETITNSTQGCTVLRSNYYAQDKSESFKEAKNMIEAGGSIESVLEGAEPGIEKLVKNNTAGMENSFGIKDASLSEQIPIGIPRHFASSWLGLQLYISQQIRKTGWTFSRAFSLYWGSNWNSMPIKGHVVMGGYDKKRIIEPNVTAPLKYGDYSKSDGCFTGIRIVISDITVNFTDGSNKSIFPNKDKLHACLAPQRPSLLEPPREYLDKFEEVTGTKHNGNTSSGFHWGAWIYDRKQSFKGDMTFHLESGLKIRIPNTQYMPPHVYHDEDGSRVMDTSARELAMPETLNGVPMLGRYFLTSAYLMVNHDVGTYTLWESNQNTSIWKNDLVMIKDDEIAAQCPDNATKPVETPSVSTTEVIPESTTTVEQTESGSSVASPATIGGSVVGGVIGAAIIALAAAWFIRRGRAAASDAPVEMGASSAAGEYDDRKLMPPVYEAYGSRPEPDAEMMGSRPLPEAEMVGSQPLPTEMLGNLIYELDDNTVGTGTMFGSPTVVGNPDEHFENRSDSDRESILRTGKQ